MHTAVHSARAAELDPYLEKTEKRLTFLLGIRRLRERRAALLKQVAEVDRELAAQADALRQALLEAGIESAA